MSSTIKIGLSGLAAASSRLEVAASNIANTSNPKNTGFADTLDGLTSRQAYQAKQVRTVPLNNGGVKADVVDIPIGSEISLAQEIIQLKLAEHTYKANATVIKTAFEVEEKLLETFSKQEK